MSEISDEKFERLEQIAQGVDVTNLPTVLQAIQKCIGPALGHRDVIASLDLEEAHILADLLMTRLLMEALGHLLSEPNKEILQLVIATYKEGMKEHWWYA